VKTSWQRGQKTCTVLTRGLSDAPTGSTACDRHSTRGQRPKCWCVNFSYWFQGEGGGRDITPGTTIGGGVYLSLCRNSTKPIRLRLPYCYRFALVSRSIASMPNDFVSHTDAVLASI
jgi:hypothetical protein